MANVKCSFARLEDIAAKFEMMKNSPEKDQLMQTGVNRLAAVYLASAKKNTPVGKRQEQLVSEKAYGNIKGLEVKSKDYKRSGSVSRTLKRVRKTATGKRYTILSTSEHMRRCWGVDAVEKSGNMVTGTTYRVKVYNSASYASYVNDGHRQKPGRYVPMLGKRLVKGWVEGRHMAEIAAAKTKKKSKRILSDLLNAYLARGLNGK